MENSLRDKVKDFRAVQRAYESISKHNQVCGMPRAAGINAGGVTQSLPR